MTLRIAVQVEEGRDFDACLRQRLAQMCAPYGTIRNVDIYFDEVRRPRSGVVIVDFETLDQLNAVIAALDATLFADGAAFYFYETDAP